MFSAHGMNSSPTKVEFRPPAIGSTQVPIKITGPGTIELREDGLHAVGAEVAERGRALAVLVGLGVFCVGMVLLKSQLGLGSGASAGISAAAGAIILLPSLRKPAKAGEPMELSFPWSNVKKVMYDGAAQCLVVVIKGMKPKGGLFIVQPANSDLERAIAARLN